MESGRKEEKGKQNVARTQNKTHYAKNIVCNTNWKNQVLCFDSFLFFWLAEQKIPSNVWDGTKEWLNKKKLFHGTRVRTSKQKQRTIGSRMHMCAQILVTVHDLLFILNNFFDFCFYYYCAVTGCTAIESSRYKMWKNLWNVWMI